MTAALLLSVCTQARTITPGENQLWWGYFNESDFNTADYTIGTGSAMTLMAAIYIPANHGQLGQSSIMGARVYLPMDASVVSALSNLKIWISKELPDKIGDVDIVQSNLGTLTTGANDLKFRTPFEVNDEGFYVGYYVKSTTGYFIRSGGVAQENAFWIGNPEVNMDWTDLTNNGLGKLAFQILVEGGNFEEYCATAEDFKPVVVEMGQSVNVPVTITNMGSATIKDLSYTITVNGETSEEQTLSSLSIPYNNKKEVMIPIESAASEGNYTYMLTFTKINGNDNTASHNTATGRITTVQELKTWARNVLIEEFTTEYCVYCPQAANGLASYMKNYPALAERTAVACHHDGYYTDWLTVSASSSYTWFYNDNGSTYAPAFMYDRYAWDGKTPVESRQSSATGYKNRVEARIAEPSYANIVMDANFNEEETKITVTCECERSWDFCDTPARLTIFLTEDNITAKSQSGASGTFIHQHVLRAVNTTWGKVLSWNDNKATVTYTFNLNSSWKKNDLKVIAFISGYDSKDPTNCVVENVAFTAPSEATSVKTLNTNESEAVSHYSIDGRKLSNSQKGINIIRMSDGTVKKVLY